MALAHARKHGPVQCETPTVSRPHFDMDQVLLVPQKYSIECLSSFWLRSRRVRLKKAGTNRLKITCIEVIAACQIWTDPRQSLEDALEISMRQSSTRQAAVGNCQVIPRVQQQSSDLGRKPK